MRRVIFFLCVWGASLAVFAAEKSSPEPPRRTRAEVEAVLSKTSPADAATNRSLNIVLVASAQDHGRGEHDYPAWQKAWNPLLSKAAGIRVTNAWKWPSQEQFQQADVLVFYFWNHAWTNKAYAAQFDSFLARGGGVVLLHSASIADQNPEELAERIGISFHPKRSKYRHGEVDLKIVAPPDRPLTRGLPRAIHFFDETYWPMIGDTNKVEVLATAEEESRDWPMFWTFTRGKGRVFGTVLGHYLWTHDDPYFRILVLRGIAWAARDSVSRLEPRATVGIQFKD